MNATSNDLAHPRFSIFTDPTRKDALIMPVTSPHLTPGSRARRRARNVAAASLASGLALLGSTMASPARAVAPGAIQAFGSNTSGQLGNGTTTSSPQPDYFPVPAPVLNGATDLSLVTAVSGGRAHSLALQTSNTVRAWGRNGDGQLGNCSSTDSPLPVTVGDNATCTTTLSQITDIDGGGNHSLAVKNNDTVWAWGSNASGQLGDGSTTSRSYAGQVKTNNTPTYLTGITAASAGFDHSLALKSDGTVWAWGDNTDGQLGDSTNTNSSYAAKVKTVGATCAATNADLSSVTEVAAGAGHSLALKSDGTVWAWGNNEEGQLGDGTTANQKCAVQVTDSMGNLTSVVHISAGWRFSVAVKSDGSVWAWGDNLYGQLGNNNVPNDSSVAVQVQDAAGGNLSGVASVSAGGHHTLAIKATSGAVSCWGRADHGECGTAAGIIAGPPPYRTYYQPTAVPVVGVAAATAVAGGGSHSLVL